MLYERHICSQGSDLHILRWARSLFLIYFSFMIIHLGHLIFYSLPVTIKILYSEPHCILSNCYDTLLLLCCFTKYGVVSEWSLFPSNQAGDQLKLVLELSSCHQTYIYFCLLIMWKGFVGSAINGFIIIIIIIIIFFVAYFSDSVTDVKLVEVQGRSKIFIKVGHYHFVWRNGLK